MTNLREMLAKMKPEDCAELLLDAVEALKLRRHHDEDCADATEKFEPHEMCECGASVARETLARIEQKLKEQR